MHKTPRNISAIFLALSVLLTTAFVAHAQETDVDKLLKSDIAQNVTVEAVKNDKVVSGKNDNGEVELQYVRYVGLDSDKQQNDQVELRVVGTSAPENGTIQVWLEEANYMVEPTPDADGNWSATIPLSAFDGGEEEVTLQISQNGVMSNSVTIATANVEVVEALSTATWVYLLSTSLAIITLLLAITIQLRHNSKMLSPV